MHECGKQPCHETCKVIEIIGCEQSLTTICGGIVLGSFQSDIVGAGASQNSFAYTIDDAARPVREFPGGHGLHN